MRDLSSAGASTAERDRLERKLMAQVVPLVDRFVWEVAKAASGGTALTAAAVSPSTFSPAKVTALWSETVSRVAGTVLAHVPQSAREWYLTRLTRRLLGSDFAEQAYVAVRAVLDNAATQGWSQREVMRQVRDALKPGSDSSPWGATARRIARTEATSAHSVTTITELAAQGFTGKRWVAHFDDRTRPEHARANGQVVPLDADFLVGGYALAYPGDPDAPIMLTANCRCVLVGVR